MIDTMMLNIRTVTVGPVHAEEGDPNKVARYCHLLKKLPDFDFEPIEVREKPNGTYRVYDGRHRFLAYVLAQREHIPAVIRHEHHYEVAQREELVKVVMGALGDNRFGLTSWEHIREKAEAVVDALPGPPS